MSTYKLKKDIKVASGKQVVDALLEEVGSSKVESLLKENRNFRSLALDYTTDKELFNRVNKRFIDKGYDAVEDINDAATDMPIIVFNSKTTFGKPTSIRAGKDALDDYFAKQKHKRVTSNT